MTHLILTTDDSGAGALRSAGIADIVIPFGLRFARGPLPSNGELETLVARRSTKYGPAGSHWLDNFTPRQLGAIGNEISLVDLCERCETIDLWIDPEPNAQLILIWLLDYLRPHKGIAAKLRLAQADVAIGIHDPMELAEWRQPVEPILTAHLELAGAAWQAYRAPTPQVWFNLLGRDLNALPQLGDAVLGLLEELPGSATGLGATEMRMLELISAGYVRPFDLFPGAGKFNKRRVFGYWEIGSLLDGLAHCPVPAVSGLSEGPFTLAMHDDRSRHDRYKQSTVSLTAFGEAILAGADDFSRHNPVHRWWGGTELTSGSLWRWDSASRALIAP